MLQHGTLPYEIQSWEGERIDREDLSDCGTYPEDAFSLHSREKASHWSVPWSDLMMTLFILFAVLYAYHSPHRRALTRDREAKPKVLQTFILAGRPESASAHAMGLSRIYDISKETLQAKDLRRIASVDFVPEKGVRISLVGNLLFETGRADLKPEVKGALVKIAGVLEQAPYMVNLVGHTDDRPIHSEKYPSNWELSTSRACAVARFLINEMKLPPEQFFVTGHAEYEPVGAKHAANRLVEIIITGERSNTVSRKSP